MICVYIPVGCEVERNKQGQEEYIPQLEDKFMLPEILNPLHKPSCIL